MGRISNRAGIGAWVQVTSDGDQIREVNGGSGFASQDSLPVEFGLGGWDGAVDVTVRWPSGVQSSLSGIMTDRAITVTEPAPDLSGAAKAVSADTALPGEVLTYSLVVPNAGDLSAPARVTDTLPAALNGGGYVTATVGTATWDVGQRCLYWSGVISEEMGVTITYRVTVSAGLAPGKAITNVATVADGYRPPFDTPPVTVTILCRELAGVGLDYEPHPPVAGQGVTS